LTSEAYGVEAMKMSSVSNAMNGSKRVARTGKIMKDVVVQDLTEENIEKVRNLVHSDRCLNIRAMSVQINSDKETVTCV
jgi:ribosomal protein S13